MELLVIYRMLLLSILTFSPRKKIMIGRVDIMSSKCWVILSLVLTLSTLTTYIQSSLLSRSLLIVTRTSASLLVRSYSLSRMIVYNKYYHLSWMCICKCFSIGVVFTLLTIWALLYHRGTFHCWRERDGTLVQNLYLYLPHRSNNPLRVFDKLET